jgi:hypothetical protein
MKPAVEKMIREAKRTGEVARQLVNKRCRPGWMK